mmetsp:Transcript_5436/g.17193  ORF Transcript_5436/g.17193 Transcript_5436/m.17193 type:complete len:227 (-) Transcript_5436:479-1159(-)
MAGPLSPLGRLVVRLQWPRRHGGGVEAEEIIFEEANVARRQRRHERRVVVFGGRIGGVAKGFCVVGDVPPKGRRGLWQSLCGSRGERVLEEGTVAARVHRVLHREEEPGVELEVARELAQELEHRVDEEEEDRRALLRGRVVAVSAPLIKLVAKVDPFSLHQGEEAVDGAEPRLEHEQSQDCDLGRAVPAVRAVHEHSRLVVVDALDGAHGQGQDGVDLLEPGGGV